ncbi:MAG TPA: alpha/beta fold hydrolase [Solirubrobacterales bacterium]|jgi:pimeloyl-ACP methyl ester carboxylesterase
MVFVHGGTGSGGQFESQKLRFTENGYPDAYVRVFEYDSTFSVESPADVQARLDTFINQVKQETGRSQVDLLGHSLGTAVSQTYLTSSPAHAANVAHYVNIDGAQAASPPGGVPTLAIWAGRGTPGRSIGGATNVTVPNQTHVQSATSPESFAAMFRFFTGRHPRTTDILRERGKIRIAGRAQLFPQNVGVPAGTTLTIWRVKKSNGRRIAHPVATPALAVDGSWGPVRVRSGKRYEFVLEQQGQFHHFFYEPFRRSDDLIRLLTNVPGTGLDLIQDRSPNHVNLIMVRYKELWGDQGAENDVLSVNGTNVINAATSPVDHRTNAMFVFDKGSDGLSDVTSPIPVFFGLPFLSAVDLFIPAAWPPNSTVRVDLRSRGSRRTREVSFPNYPSSNNTITVQLNDFER